VLHQELAVAFSALGMGLDGVVTTLMVPLLRSLIAHQ
jgi:putative effector of murein hydrolase